MLERLRTAVYGGIGLVLMLTLLAPVSLAEPLTQVAATTAGYRVPHYSAGVQAYRIGDYERAVNYFRRVLAHDHGHVNAQYYLAICLDRLGIGDEAVLAYQRVVQSATEPKLVQYAQTRLTVLQPNRGVSYKQPVEATTLMASAGRVLPAVQRGAAAHIAVPLKNNRNALMVDALTTKENRAATGVFIIDTGATYTSISQDMAERLGLDLSRAEKIRITTANGRIEVPKVTLDTLSVNGLEARNVEATVIQVRPGSSFSGLLGLSFIRQFVLTIDPQANQLIFQRQ